MLRATRLLLGPPAFCLGHPFCLGQAHGNCGLRSQVRALSLTRSPLPTSTQLKHEVAVGSPVSRLALHRGSGLCAVACDDLSIRVYDIEAAGRLVRRFKGHS